MIELRNENTKGIAGLCIEIHDLVVGKYVSARPKDYKFVRYLVNKGHVDQAVLLERLKEVNLSEERKERVKQKIEADFTNV